MDDDGQWGDDTLDSGSFVDDDGNSKDEAEFLVTGSSYYGVRGGLDDSGDEQDGDAELYAIWEYHVTCGTNTTSGAKAGPPTTVAYSD